MPSLPRSCMVCLMVYPAWHAAVPAPAASTHHGQETVCRRPMLPKDPPGHHVLHHYAMLNMRSPQSGLLAALGWAAHLHKDGHDDSSSVGTAALAAWQAPWRPPL